MLFLKINCITSQGNKYWRFDNGVLDDDYPRDISVGFDKIPDYVDAAFALPAPGHNGKEKVFFFKGIFSLRCIFLMHVLYSVLKVFYYGVLCSNRGSVLCV